MSSLTPFWSVSLFWAAAVLCVVIALAFVLPPLLRRRAAEAKAARKDINIAVYRDQMREMEAERASGLLSDAQFESAKLELEARLAEDALTQADASAVAKSSRKLGYGLALVLPTAAFGLYFMLGHPMALMSIAEAAANPGAAAVPGEHDIMKMIQQVEKKTRDDPKDGEAWHMLAKTYAAVGRWPDALVAYEQAVTLLPKTPSVMTGYAEALAISNNRVLQGKPIELVLQALEIDPNDLKGLELAGIAAYQERSYAQAVYYFKHLYKQLPPESPYAQDILEAQKDAKRLSEGALTGMDDLSDPAAPLKPAADARIQGSIDLAPALKDKVSGDDVIFLFARAGNAGAPVAAIRAKVGKFPLDFELNDGMAMNPDNKLSSHKEVVLTARIAKSGDIKGAAGDLEGSVKAVKVGAQGVKVVIDSVRK
jgi:cytochrome c-type biogenesis protein CcmH